MSAYLAELNAYAKAHKDREESEAEAKIAAEVEAVRARLTPLDTRLERLLADIPIEVCRDGLSLPSLQGMLKGRTRGHCHPGDLGKAFRRLGWVRRRRWSGQDGSPAYWYPP